MPVCGRRIASVCVCAAGLLLAGRPASAQAQAPTVAFEQMVAELGHEDPNVRLRAVREARQSVELVQQQKTLQIHRLGLRLPQLQDLNVDHHGVILGVLKNEGQHAVELEFELSPVIQTRRVAADEVDELTERVHKAVLG